MKSCKWSLGAPMKTSSRLCYLWARNDESAIESPRVRDTQGEFSDGALVTATLAYNRGRFRREAMLHFPSPHLPFFPAVSYSFCPPTYRNNYTARRKRHWLFSPLPRFSCSFFPLARPDEQLSPAKRGAAKGARALLSSEYRQTSSEGGWGSDGQDFSGNKNSI